MGTYATGQPWNFNESDPAPPSGEVNVVFQADAPTAPPTAVVRGVSAYMPVMTSTVGGAVPTPPNVATEYLDGTGNWSTPGGGGGGGSLKPGTLVTPGTRGTGTNPNWANWTIEACIFAELVVNPTDSWKIRISAIGGTGISLHQTALIKTARGSLVAAEVIPITWNGGGASYAVAFSGVSASNPFYLDSDVMSQQLNDLFDWYFCIYLDTDGTGYNANLVLWNAANSSSGIAYERASNNNIPSVGGSVAAVAFGNPSLVVAVIAESAYTGS